MINELINGPKLEGAAAVVWSAFHEKAVKLFFSGTSFYLAGN
jgi:hypothetical protein